MSPGLSHLLPSQFPPCVIQIKQEKAMRTGMVGVLALGCGLIGGPVWAGEPLVEKYLHAGQLEKGEVALAAELARSPKDDQLRFGLGTLQFLRGVERLAQSMYRYGLRSER